ncbi:High-affinity branched-chain amino acid transport ATP-binding protein LivF [Paenibacillus solanacearum]|uniref:High-affinity branched-chain amino acid transport ATP-binding protein LivF n=1 Tax=Paenibacillus solanacearum TaxID=2048548 RepID=A0A916NIE6_9BACL|nr:urea ABC transporter ATP-binding subunit UrtE [Paenibacillus solanacearum]CAG7616201.1 High-affinity branched-chain amino acid transport ATP-binding protein LivF [Paenibacillus solanacearum]
MTKAGNTLTIDKLASGYGESMVLREITMKVRPGQVVCLMGRNGVGKTTLMKTIMGLIKPKNGTIRYGEQELTAAPPYRHARAGIGYVPQGRDIFSQLTVEENLKIGLEAAGGSLRKAGIPESVYEKFPVLGQMLKRKGGDLSGGQQQQLAIARALVAEPKLLLLDEPMEGIQPSIVMDIERVIESIKANQSMSVLLVEQSLTFATSIADYYYVLDKGMIVAEGTPASLSEDQVRKHLAV